MDPCHITIIFMFVLSIFTFITSFGYKHESTVYDYYIYNDKCNFDYNTNSLNYTCSYYSKIKKHYCILEDKNIYKNIYRRIPYCNQHEHRENLFILRISSIVGFLIFFFILLFKFVDVERIVSYCLNVNNQRASI